MSDDDTVTVTITRAEYEALEESDRTLTLLENAGVDNWEWYGEALNHPEEFE
jgi:hypothetical protein